MKNSQAQNKPGTAADGKKGGIKDSPSKPGSVAGVKSPNGTAAKGSGSSLLVLTNQNRKKGIDYSRPTMPASFKSKYSEFRMENEGNQHGKNLDFVFADKLDNSKLLQQTSNRALSKDLQNVMGH